VSQATILGGRWDGHTVDYVGPEMLYKGVVYVCLTGKTGRHFYLPKTMRDQWFVFH